MATLHAHGVGGMGSILYEARNGCKDCNFVAYVKRIMILLYVHY